MKIYAVVLAGGKSSRFKSSKTKVLHNLLGKPVLLYIIEELKKSDYISRIFVITGRNSGNIRSILPEDILTVEQKVPLGTGDAVRVTFDYIKRNDEVHLLVLPGDAPLITKESIEKLIEKHIREKNSCTFLTAELDNPYGYGRVVRADGRPIRIVEESDATPKEKNIKEINAGVYVFELETLKEAVLEIKPDNVKGEYYITDCIGVIFSHGKKVDAIKLEDPSEILGINTREDFEKVFKAMKDRIIDYWLEKGVTIMDRNSVYIEKDVEIGEDSVIYPMVYLMGKTKIGKSCNIGPFVVLNNAEVKDNTTLIGAKIIKQS